MNDESISKSRAKWIIDAVYFGETSWRSKAVFVLLCVTPILSTVAYGGVDAIALGFQALIAAAIGLLWFAEARRARELRFNSSYLQLPIIGLIVIGAIQLLPLGDPGIASGVLNIPPSAALSLDPYATQMFVVRLTVYLVFFAAALTFIDTTERARKLAVAIIIFGSLMAFFGILQRLANPEAIYGLRPTPQAIPFGPFVNQHHFAAFMEMTSGVVLGLLFGHGVKRDRRLLLWIAAVLMGIALVFTGSRGGVLSYAGVIVFAMMASYFLGNASELADKTARSSTTRFSLLAGSAALLLIVAGLVFYLGGGDSLLRGIGIQESYSDITSGRIHYWNVALKIFAEHPILGAGLDAFGVAFPKFDTQNGMYRVEQAHNDYLQTLADAGVIGFACVAAFLVFLFRGGLRTITKLKDRFSRSLAVGSLAGCFGILIHSFFDFPLRTPSNAFFFLLLVVFATTTLYGREPNGEGSEKGQNRER